MMNRAAPTGMAESVSEAGIAAGGDVVLIPEIPFRYEAAAAGIPLELFERPASSTPR